ncbi:MAG TPA: histidinol-phosphate transaminase [Terriglobales bacterium]|nr:histidinol-phosphate transaminase [Terriglobales bacterium]
MADFTKLVPEYVRTLVGYTPGKPVRQAEQESGVSCIKMASNENPFGPSPRAMEAMRAAAEQAHFYPDNDTVDLRLKLAERFCVKAEQVLVTAGSTELINDLARVLLRPGLNAITSRLSFIIYPIATQASGGTLIQVPMRDNGFDLNAIAAAIDQSTRLIYLANPNNPTGTMFDAGEFDDFLEQVPENVIVALDEAYCDFATHFAAARGVIYSRALDYVRAGRQNLVVLRTFSKAHGLAGLRIGYGCGAAELMGYLGRVRTTFSVSSVAQAAALAALDDEGHVRHALENNAAGAEFLTQTVSELGFRVTPTWANFIYVELGEEAAPLGKRLQEQGVIVRPLAPWGAPSSMRVTVGTREQNEFFVSALRKVVRVATMRG